MPRVFISAGEPSGDLHGANLIRSLKDLCPTVECAGFGGERMAATGTPLLYPLCDLAIMGFVRVPAHLLSFVRLLRRADESFRDQRPDAVVLIDFPGFHWWLARSARSHGIPVYYFVPPQLWAWAGWRIGKMRKSVNRALCSLPFEEEWFRSRGVAADYVGHPYFDELPRQVLDAEFLAAQRRRPGTVVGLLPGSRHQELEQNLATLIGAAERIREADHHSRFLFACLKPEHGRMVEDRLAVRNLAAEVHVGRTAEVIEASYACVAVSGSVGLELLYRNKPSVILYRTNRVGLLAASALMKCRYISLVNLLAEKEIFPEFRTCRDEAAGVADVVIRWLKDPACHDRVRQEMARVASQVARAGACQKAAQLILEAAASRSWPQPARLAG